MYTVKVLEGNTGRYSRDHRVWEDFPQWLGAKVQRRLSWVYPGTWASFPKYVSLTAPSPLCWNLLFPSVVRGKGCASYIAGNHLRNYQTYFILFCNGVYQKICPNIVNIWNQDWWILWNTVSWIKIWLKFLIPVLPITYTVSKNSSSYNCILWK